MPSPLSPLRLALPCACALAFLVASTFAVDSAAAPRNSTRATTPRMARLRPAPPPPEADVPPASSDDGGIFGPLRIGPLAGVSVPRPLSIELFLKYKRAVGIGLEYSVLPTLNVDGVSVHASAIAGDLR